MLKPRILVTGATGKTGSVVVAELLKPAIPSAPCCAEKMAVARS
jgi:FlaA1/EpsC-like NDP-sugar epimerase